MTTAPRSFDDTLVAAVARAQGGDEAAFGQIVRAHHDDMTRVCFTISGDLDLADEAVAAAWAIAWRDPSGALRRIEGLELPTPSDDTTDPWAGRIHWSPDGTRLAIEAGNGRSGSSSSIDTYLVAVDGSAQRVLRDARAVVWSPDSTELAFVHRVGLDYPDADGPVAPGSIEVVGMDGSGPRQVVVPPAGLGGFSIMWAAS